LASQQGWRDFLHLSHISAIDITAETSGGPAQIKNKGSAFARVPALCGTVIWTSLRGEIFYPDEEGFPVSLEMIYTT